MDTEVDMAAMEWVDMAAATAWVDMAATEVDTAAMGWATVV